MTGERVSRPLVAAARSVWTADRLGCGAAAALQIAGSLSGLIVVLASKLALDAVLDGGSGVTGSLIWALILLSLATALSSSVGPVQQQQQRLLAERVDEHLWSRLLAVSVSVDLVTWQSPGFLDRLDRIRSNSLARPTQVVTSLFGLFGAAVGVASLVAALVVIQPLLVPLLLAAGIPSVLLSRRASRLEFAFVQTTNQTQRRRRYLKDILTARAYAAEIRAFDSGPHLTERQSAETRRLLGVLVPHVRRRQRLALVSTLISAAALALSLVLIVVLVRSGRLSLAEAGAAVIAARLLGGQLGAAFGAVSVLIESGPFLADMEAFVSSETARVPGPQQPLEQGVRLDRVRFRYPGQDRDAVDAVSITIPDGQVVALVGENGSGKSTLAKIVAGLYEPDSGTVTWDEATISAAELRSGVSILFQDFARYQMSARDNITIADTTRPVDQKRVEGAARRAGVHDVLRSLPDGYDTVLGLELSEGTDLSGGQWQRLALARAFYRDTPVLVLDEPTAALDPQAEHDLFVDVRGVLDGRAALLISHRFSSVRLADYIYVLSGGRVIEEGSHEELVGRPGGTYARLYALQAAAFLAPEMD